MNARGGHMLLLAVACAAGCATRGDGHTPAADARGPGEVLVVASEQMPELAFEPLAGHRAQSAAGAGLLAFGDCLVEIFRGMSCTGAICGAAVIVGYGICGGAALIVGGKEAVSAPARTEVDNAVREFRAAVDRRAMQDSLREQVVLNIGQRGEEFMPRLPAAAEQAYRRTRDPGPLDAAGVGAVLETNLMRAELARTGRDSTFLLSVRAGARMLRTNDGAVLYQRSFAYSGGRYSAEQWSENGSRRLIDGLAAAYETLGAQIFDSALRLYPFPDREAKGAGFLALALGLAPVYPPTRGQLSDDNVIAAKLEWFAVESLRPELRWQTFPRDVDVAAAPGAMRRVRNVRYDLVVAREHLLYPAELVYRREGLTSPQHRLEQPLLPGARYFWSVRATFDLDGRRRVSAWSAVRAESHDTLTVPHAFMYRFMTPGRGG